MEGSEAHHWASDGLDASVVLLQDVVELFDLPGRGNAPSSDELQDHVLCQIEADAANFSHGGPLLELVFRHHEYGTSRCRQG